MPVQRARTMFTSLQTVYNNYNPVPGLVIFIYLLLLFILFLFFIIFLILFIYYLWIIFQENLLKLAVSHVKNNL